MRRSSVWSGGTTLGLVFIATDGVWAVAITPLIVATPLNPRRRTRLAPHRAPSFRSVRGLLSPPSRPDCCFDAPIYLGTPPILPCARVAAHTNSRHRATQMRQREAGG